MFLNLIEIEKEAILFSKRFGESIVYLSLISYLMREIKARDFIKILITRSSLCYVKEFYRGQSVEIRQEGYNVIYRTENGNELNICPSLILDLLGFKSLSSWVLFELEEDKKRNLKF